MTIDMRNKLEEWLSKNFCPLAETAGTLVCDLRIKANNKKRTIAIAFSRYHHEPNPWEYVIPEKGYVLTVPSFWLSIPKELVIFYIESYIDGYMDDYVYGNMDESSSGNGNTGNPGSGLCPAQPPCHTPNKDYTGTGNPPQYPPCCTTADSTMNINTAITGYYTNNLGSNGSGASGSLDSISGSACPAGGCATGDCESKVTGVTNVTKTN